jgi:hypothetical protein
LNTDVFLGCEPLGLLLWYGDLAAAREGFARILDAHKRILEMVQQGAAAAGFAFEAFNAFLLLPSALLAAGELDTLRDFLHHSLTGASVNDETARASMVTLCDFLSWKADDGHCALTLDTYLLAVRGLFALCAEDTHESRTALQEWLPPPAELLRIAEYEAVFRAHSMGANHPALLLARLNGERLGNWEETVEVAEGVLEIEQFNPLLRTEAYRLLGHAYFALDARAAACEAAENAVAEAVLAKYAWLEMMSLHDLLSWCKGSEADAVRSRLRSVIKRLAASREELAGIRLREITAHRTSYAIASHL